MLILLQPSIHDGNSGQLCHVSVKPWSHFKVMHRLCLILTNLTIHSMVGTERGNIAGVMVG